MRDSCRPRVSGYPRLPKHLRSRRISSQSWRLHMTSVFATLSQAAHALKPVHVGTRDGGCICYSIALRRRTRRCVLRGSSRVTQKIPGSAAASVDSTIVQKDFALSSTPVLSTIGIVHYRHHRLLTPIDIHLQLCSADLATGRRRYHLCSSRVT